VTTETLRRRVDPRPHIDINPFLQAEQACPKCGMTAWKRQWRENQGSESITKYASVITDRTWFEAYQYLQWTCWPCGYSFETNTLEDYQKDHQREQGDSGPIGEPAGIGSGIVEG
jgi:hypothetical protein